MYWNKMIPELSVTDLDKSLAFYKPAGFVVEYDRPEDNFAFISLDNFKGSGYEISFDIEENWYRQDGKLLGNKEFLIQDPDGYLLRFFQDLGEKNI